MGRGKESTPSISSASEVSTASTSSIHKRSTPKIAAVIIVAFLIISSLAGVTVYFITSEKLLMQNRDTYVEKRIDELSYFRNKNDVRLSETSFYDETSTVKTSTSTTEERVFYDENSYEDYESYEDEDYLVAPDYVPNYEQNIPVRTVQRPQNQPGNFYTGRLGLPTNTFNVNVRKIQPGPRFRNGMLKPKHFRDGQDPEGPPYLQYEEVLPTRESNALQNPLLTVEENTAQEKLDYDNMDANMLLNLEGLGIDFSKKIEEEITEEPSQNFQNGDVNQRFFSSGMKADPNDANFQINGRRRMMLRPRMRPRGQLYVTDGQKGATLATLDRRPNRPPFHHMGPNPHMRGPPYLNQQQQNPEPQIQRRMGGVLENMQEMITLAKSEVGVLRELARNITDSGKELNLWEVLDAVNATVSDNPNSGIAKLMRRFYANYLSDENEPQLSSVPSPGTYEKSLSSLIFLSFGIFLLNSVNEHLTASSLPYRSARSFQDSELLSKLMSDHEALGSLFQGRSLEKAAGSTNSINNYLRLVMNLMNIYTSSESERDVDCVWKLYCYQLNEQAKIGGMASTVAKINSVGMKLVLEEIPGSAAFPAVLRSMIHYKDLQCEQMFPKCVQ